MNFHSVSNVDGTQLVDLIANNLIQRTTLVCHLFQDLYDARDDGRTLNAAQRMDESIGWAG